MKKDLCGGGISSVWQSPVKRMVSEEAGDRSRTSCKRIKTTQINGYIVYTRTRTRKTKFTKEGDENAGFPENRMSNHLEESKPMEGLAFSSNELCQDNSLGETDISGSSCVKNRLGESTSEKTVIEERLVTSSLATTNISGSPCVNNGLGESTSVKTVMEGRLVTGSLANTNISESSCVNSGLGESKTVVEERLVTGSLANTNISGSSCVNNGLGQSTRVKTVMEERLVTGNLAKTNISGSSCVNNGLGESTSVKTVAEERLVTGSLAKTSAGKKFKKLDTLTDSSSFVDVVIEDIGFVELLHEAIPVEILAEGSLDFEVGRVGKSHRTIKKPCCTSEEIRHRPSKRTTQIYKSVLRMKKVNSFVPEDVEEADFDCEGLNEQTYSGSLAGKSSLTRKRPQTVRELFETGILDGLSVVYMGTFKSQAFGLRGIIKDGGILCSCSSCDWAQVISTSKFEIHASKQYRRASQYICFENGKSLLDVLNICRNAPLHALEARVLNAVDSGSKEKYYTCKRCKGVFPLSSLGHRGFLCSPCSEVESFQNSPAAARTSTSAPAYITSQSRLKIIRRPAEYSSKSPVVMSPLGNSTQKITRKLTQHSATPKAFKSMPLSVSSKKRSYRMSRKDHGVHKLVFGNQGIPDGTELGYYVRGQKLLGGYKKGAGIYCNCCKSEVSASTFEAHAGWASRRKPYFFIYTSNGVSLHEWAMTFSQGRKYSANDNDNLCVICADGGNLLLCDSCPRAFHIECVSLPSIPRGNWHCKYCEKKSKSEAVGEYNVNSSGAGQPEGVDPIDQLAGRCIRVVKNMEAETNGCVLCSGSDFCRSGFGPRTMILCDQCEKEYHIGCLSSRNIVDLKELPKGNWFCSMDCTRINSTLQKLLLGGAEKPSESSVEILQMKQRGTYVDTISHLDIRWRLISGRVTSPESRMLLSQALAIFHDCFDPIVDPVSGHNLIPRMVYGKNMQGQDYGGVCCAVLTVNATVVSAGLVRVFGREVAELPLVATRMCSREKGYFQLLFSCVEKLLSSLNVESIVVPAAEEAEPLWMNKFGFRKLAPEELGKYIKICSQMVRFKGASMLRKPVASQEMIDNKIETDVISLEENFDMKQPKQEAYVHHLLC